VLNFRSKSEPDQDLEALKAQLNLALKAMDKIIAAQPELQKKFSGELLKLHALVKGGLQDDGKEH